MKNKNLYYIFLISATIMQTSQSISQKTIAFPSSDGLLITADEYIIDKTKPFILLCHQARYSRGEYIETAKKLNTLGFNCVAIDQRSGGEVNGIKNETAAKAIGHKKPVGYLDAEQDIVAAIEYIFKIYNKKVILFGSSYSASLALKIAKENDRVMAVIAFSPGEYFDNVLHLAKTILGLDKPVFTASSKSEAPGVATLLKSVKEGKAVQYIPDVKSRHGSSALWSDNGDHKKVWKALENFLNQQITNF
ncbi:MAG: hypothetical protein HYY40_05660 [Bacteroidetes bacterium]|nr:hypothetical protein [Bacteroidota bacterium]